ncbi:hypothetical protein LguiB_005259 [Lonicera macranthoides]
MWGDRFTAFSIGDDQVPDTTNLINTLERLGVSYHFDKEIEKVLDQIHPNSVFEADYDLCAVALHFRIFRQHGYNISCDVFNRFKDSNGKFREALIGDAKGMLSLYEATHVRTRGEAILDEAFAFTKSHLESMATRLTPFFANQVIHALKQPLHRGIPRVEARHYISVYEEDPSKNQLLLKFSKIDFNLLQLLHKLGRTMPSLKFESKLPYARNRAVECYLWALSVYFEPCYSLDRIILTKTLVMFSVTDDTYDAYGTFDELKLFTDAVQRWDMSAIDQLPEYMKIIYKALLDIYEDIKAILLKEGRAAHGVFYSIEAFKELVRCYNVETKWMHEKYVPPFDEYMGNALITGMNFLMAITSFMSMGEVATVEAFEWAKNKPKILVASNTVGRLMDDIMTHEEEKKRGIVATGIECYMREHGVVSKEEVMEEFYKRIENAWKDINEEYYRLPIPMPLIIRCLNLTRILDVVYKEEDGYMHLPSQNKTKVIIRLFFTGPACSIARCNTQRNSSISDARTLVSQAHLPL